MRFYSITIGTSRQRIDDSTYTKRRERNNQISKCPSFCIGSTLFGCFGSSAQMHLEGVDSLPNDVLPFWRTMSAAPPVGMIAHCVSRRHSSQGHLGVQVVQQDFGFMCSIAFHFNQDLQVFHRNGDHWKVFQCHRKVDSRFRSP